MRADAVAESLGSQLGLFVFCASFEERSLHVAKAVSRHAPATVMFVNGQRSEKTEANLRAIMDLYPKGTEVVELDYRRPISIADRFLAVVRNAVSLGTSRLTIDITTFTHEALLILLRIIQLIPTADLGVYLVYTGAAEYFVSAKDESDRWLSKGVAEVRSVLGYSGSRDPSKKLHLIVLAGFETERAHKLIAVIEPAKLTVGVGDPSESVSSALYNQNAAFHRRVVEQS